MTLASYDSPPIGVPFLMVCALIGLAAFWTWQRSSGEPGWLRTPLVTTTTVLGVLAVVFMAWASA